ncbi:MAG TPA: carbonic anhydrase [Rhizomicrobium sp.]|jgi:carbonic anhydrase|nr:carbonic anhydrase [Rhizomicrobium sp.]HWA12912.1 carbonic anhydrase [Burkholderiales bacterium]
MERLIRGYRDFRKRRWPAERERYIELSRKGQKPEYLIIACSDSRSDPATIFDAHPGEFFVVRMIAAIVPPYEEKVGFFGTRSAIAYGVMALNVRNIVVMGHAQCGGVAAALDPQSANGIPFVKEWVSLLNPVVEGAVCEPHGSDPCPNVERETVKLSVRRLLDYPFIAERVGAGTLKVDGARFGIADGVLEVLDQKTGAFEPVKPRSFFSFGR